MQPRLVTNYPSALDVLVFTAPYNLPLSFQQLLEQAGGGGARLDPSAPANPRPGQTWWNGSGLELWDGSNWQAIGGGGSLTLPLSVADGGTGVTTIGAAPWLPLTSTVTDTAGGVVMTVNDSSWARPGIKIDVTDGYGMLLTSANYASPFQLNIGVSGGWIVVSNGNTAGVPGLTVQNLPAATGPGIVADQALSTGSVGLRGLFGTNGTGMELCRAPSQTGGVALALQRWSGGTGTTGTGLALGDIVFQGKADSPLNSPPQTGAEIVAETTQAWNATSAGCRIVFRTTPNGTRGPQAVLSIENNRTLMLWDGAAMQTVTIGAADSGGTGFRQLVVPN